MHVLRTLPSHVAVAVSGGVDSLVLLHWLNQRRQVTAVHYRHDSDFAADEYLFVSNFCQDRGINLITQSQTPSSQRGLSQEEYWRRARYEFFKSITLPVCTGHTLDDAVEWYLFSCLNGQGHYIEYSHANVIRPFLATRKSELIDYAQTHQIPWLEDPSNQDVEFAARNRIRHDILPSALQVNPGLHNMVRKRIIEKLGRV